MKEGGRKEVITYARIREQITGAIPRAGSFRSDLENLQKTMGSMEPMLYGMEQSQTEFTDRYGILLKNVESQILRLLQHGTPMNLESIHKSLKNLYNEYLKREMEEMAMSKEGKQKKYDIFLNFRGVDVRYTVAGLLHNHLEKANISTFFDERSVPKSKEYWEEIKMAISTSEGAITILSENYGDSEDCLNELLLIQKREKTRKGYMLRPIFYDVKPEHLTDPKSKFGQGLQKHKNTAHQGNVKEWRGALEYVRCFSGDVHNSKQDHLDVLIDKVVEDFKNQMQNKRGRKRSHHQK